MFDVLYLARRENERSGKSEVHLTVRKNGAHTLCQATMRTPRGGREPGWGRPIRQFVEQGLGLVTCDWCVDALVSRLPKGSTLPGLSERLAMRAAAA